MTATNDGVNATPTTIGYDALYATSVTDPKNHVYQFAYDATGALTSRTDPAGLTEYFKYGRNRELLRYTNRRGHHIYLAYDQLLRRTARWGDNLLADTLGDSADGRVIAGISRINASSRLSVDTLWLNPRLQPERAKIARVYYGQTIELQYAYTAEGRRQSVSASGGPGGFLARQYNYAASSGLLSWIKFGADATTITRNADLQPTTITLPGSSHSITNQFSGVHGRTRQSSVVLNFDFHSDERERIDQRNDWTTETQRRYSYDDLGRLVSTAFGSGLSCTFVQWYGWYCGASTGDSSHTFTYDAIGNRTDMGATYTGNRLTAFDGCSYGYDADGNVTSRSCPGETVTFTWDALNRLTAMTVDGATSNFRYDAFGRLIRQWGGTISDRNLIWGGDNLFAALNWNLTSRLEEYSYYPGLDNLHALWTSNTGITFAHTDALGNVVGLTDKNKTVKRTYDYDEWGRLIGGTDNGLSGRDPVRFKGALHLGPTNVEFYYMRNRWYEPKTGRFLNEDPLGIEAGLNLYAFASNDPINRADPTGLDDCWAIWKITTIYNSETLEIVDQKWELQGIVCFEEGDGGDPVARWLAGSGGSGRTGGSQSCAAPGQPLEYPLYLDIGSPFQAIRSVGTSPHIGMDYRAPLGSRVYSMTGGRVAQVVYGNPTAGNYVAVQAAPGLTYRYLHLGEIFVHPGNAVVPGSFIAYSGQSGGVSPHLHVDANLNGQYVNPASCSSRGPN